MCSFKQISLGVVLLIYVITATSADVYKIIESKNGQIRGLRKTTLLKNIPFYSFKGIPYAKPPVGKLRFKVNKIWAFCHCCKTKTNKVRSFVKATNDKSIRMNEQMFIYNSAFHGFIFSIVWTNQNIFILINFIGSRTDRIMGTNYIRRIRTW